MNILLKTLVLYFFCSFSNALDPSQQQQALEISGTVSTSLDQMSQQLNVSQDDLKMVLDAMLPQNTSILTLSSNVDWNTTKLLACSIAKLGGYFGKIPSQCPHNYEKSGLLCYPPCKDGFSGFGPFCSSGAKVRGRGFGVPMKCDNSTSKPFLGLCYEKCPKGYRKRWFFACKQKCPKLFPFECGSLCFREQRFCALIRLATASKILGIAGNIAKGVGGILGGASLPVATGSISQATSDTAALGQEMIRRRVSYPQCPLED